MREQRIEPKSTCDIAVPFQASEATKEAQWAECLLCWCEDLSSIHRTYRRKKAGMGAEMDGSLELAEQPDEVLDEF